MSYFKSMQVAQCRICNSTNIHIQRNADGLFVATCWHCGNVTQPEALATDMEAQLRWQPLAELHMEQVSA